jgi:hypothetical protein
MLRAAVFSEDEAENSSTEPTAKRAKRAAASCQDGRENTARGCKDSAKDRVAQAGTGELQRQSVESELKKCKPKRPKTGKGEILLTPNRQGDGFVQKIGMEAISTQDISASPSSLAKTPGLDGDQDKPKAAILKRSMPAMPSAKFTPRTRERHRRELRQHYNLSPLTPTSRQQRCKREIGRF